VQKPHPPIWVTAIRPPATFEYAVDRGYGIISGNPYRSDPQFREADLVYRDTLTAMGKPELIKQFWALAPTFVHLLSARC
jgi:alkanesulfonate monooxygenase SsuD/methylene tetrahydromethanopterin reductase-like flavin-dependent oxidoreductase (luciferase family)